MSRPESDESDEAVRLSQVPARSYEIPGGPLARDLGSVDVYKLAEIARGGKNDSVR